MNFMMLKAKLHRACVTDANKEYEGSIAIDKDLMDAVGILPFEQIDCYNINNGERFTTYAIVAEAGSKTIAIQGAAAHKASKGDRVIICAYVHATPEEATTLLPTRALLDKQNNIKDIKNG